MPASSRSRRTACASRCAAASRGPRSSSRSWRRPRRRGPPPDLPAAPPSGIVLVESPMVGNFYRSSSPDADPFVQEGDRVEVGQVLCILEAMKLFNEFKSDHAGTVREGARGRRAAGRVRPAAVRARSPVKRVLVANRGEIAVRVIRACHELGLEAVAVYSTADREGAWVRLADRAVCIGPPSARESYLNQSNVIGAAETTGCDALHPGYGFLSESPSFVRACEDNDLIFVGPTAESMEVLGDKSLAKGAMRDAGMPLVPGSEGRLDGRGRGAARGGRRRLPGAAQGGLRRRRPRHAPGRRAVRARGRVRDGDRRGPGGLRRRRAVPREDRRRRPPHRGAGARRRRGRRARARRARVQRPAPPPEAARGVALAVPERRGARRSCTTPRSARCARRATATPARSSACSAATSRSTSWR